METRISKYLSYRAEILNNSLIAEKIIADSLLTNEYKKQIDGLNPIILSNLKYNLSFGKLISINKTSKAEIEQLSKIVADINEKEVSSLIQLIEEWTRKHKLRSIITEENKISSSWLDEDENYAKLTSNKHRLEILSNNRIKFQVTSREQITKLDQLSKSEATLNDFKNMEILPKKDWPTSYSFKAFGVWSLIFSLLLLVTSIFFLAAELMIN